MPEIRSILKIPEFPFNAKSSERKFRWEQETTNQQKYGTLHSMQRLRLVYVWSHVAPSHHLWTTFEGTCHPFPVENHGHRLRGADLHTRLIILGCISNIKQVISSNNARKTTSSRPPCLCAGCLLCCSYTLKSCQLKSVATGSLIATQQVWLFAVTDLLLHKDIRVSLVRAAVHLWALSAGQWHRVKPAAG